MSKPIKSKVLKNIKVEEKIDPSVKEEFKENAERMFNTFGVRYEGFYKYLRQFIDDKYNGNVKKFFDENEEKLDMIEFEFLAFDKAKSDEKVYIDKLDHTEDVRGVVCANCGSGYTGSESRQFRSLDEGATTRFFCNNCKK